MSSQTNNPLASIAPSPSFHPTCASNRNSVFVDFEELTEGGRVATPFGVGIVTVIREKDGFIVVKLPFGTGYFNPQCLRKNTYRMILCEMEKLMIQGNLCVAERQIEQAVVCYEKAVKLAPFAIQDRPEIKLLLAQVFSHQAYCFMSLERYDRALFLCDMALRYDPSNVKALFRMGQAHTRLGNFRLADLFFKKAMRFHHSVSGLKREIRIELNLNNERLRQADSKSKRIFSGVFEWKDTDHEIGPKKEKIRRTQQHDGGQSDEIYCSSQYYSLVPETAFSAEDSNHGLVPAFDTDNPYVISRRRKPHVSLWSILNTSATIPVWAIAAATVVSVVACRYLFRVSRPSN